MTSPSHGRNSLVTELLGEPNELVTVVTMMTVGVLPPVAVKLVGGRWVVVGTLAIHCEQNKSRVFMAMERSTVPEQQPVTQRVI